jgi:hypothetical protein
MSRFFSSSHFHPRNLSLLPVFIDEKCVYLIQTSKQAIVMVRFEETA